MTFEEFLKNRKDINFTTTELTIFNYSDNNILSDIEGIENFKKLKYLRIDYGDIKGDIIDISPLKYLNKLTELRITSHKIEDVTPLSYLTKLKLVALSGNNISNIVPLSKIKNLKELYIPNNNIIDFTCLKINKKLHTLSCGKNLGIKGIELLSQLKALHIDEEWYYSSINDKMKEIKSLNRKHKIDKLLNDI